MKATGLLEKEEGSHPYIFTGKRRGRITRKRRRGGRNPLTVRRTKESAQKCNRTRSEPIDSSF